MTTENQSPAPGQSPCACWPGRLCDRSAKCSAEAMVRATPAPAAATGKPGLQVAQAPAVPVGAEPVSLAAAVRLGLEYAREALATHDQQFANHPATALERGSIVADERERCARLCQEIAEDYQRAQEFGREVASNYCATAIRSDVHTQVTGMQGEKL